MDPFRSSSRPPKCTSHLGIGLVLQRRLVVDLWFQRFLLECSRHPALPPGTPCWCRISRALSRCWSVMSPASLHMGAAGARYPTESSRNWWMVAAQPPVAPLSSVTSQAKPGLLAQGSHPLPGFLPGPAVPVAGGLAAVGAVADAVQVVQHRHGVEVGQGPVAARVAGLLEVEGGIAGLQLARGAEGGLGPGFLQGPSVAGGDAGLAGGPAIAEASGVRGSGDVVGNGGPVQQVQVQSSGVDCGPRYRRGAGLGKGRLSPCWYPAGAYRVQVFPCPSPSCRSPLQGLFLEMGSTRELSSQRCPGLGWRGSHCPASAGWSSVVLIIGAVVTGHVLSLVPRGRFPSLGPAAPAGLPVLVGAGPALSEFLGSLPPYLFAEAPVLHALWVLASCAVGISAGLCRFLSGGFYLLRCFAGLGLEGALLHCRSMGRLVQGFSECSPLRCFSLLGFRR